MPHNHDMHIHDPATGLVNQVYFDASDTFLPSLLALWVLAMKADNVEGGHAGSIESGTQMIDHVKNRLFLEHKEAVSVLDVIPEAALVQVLEKRGLTAIKKWDGKEKSPAFLKKDEVRHIKSEGIYVIQATPDDGIRVESTGEPGYVYSSITQEEGKRPVLWVRGQTEMEDGRFEWISGRTPSYPTQEKHDGEAS